jgi:hypothetical protein
MCVRPFAAAAAPQGDFVVDVFKKQQQKFRAYMEAHNKLKIPLDDDEKAIKAYAQQVEAIKNKVRSLAKCQNPESLAPRAMRSPDLGCRTTGLETSRSPCATRLTTTPALLEASGNDDGTGRTRRGLRTMQSHTHYSARVRPCACICIQCTSGVIPEHALSPLNRLANIIAPLLLSRKIRRRINVMVWICEVHQVHVVALLNALLGGCWWRPLPLTGLPSDGFWSSWRSRRRSSAWARR